MLPSIQIFDVSISWYYLFVFLAAVSCFIFLFRYSNNKYYGKFKESKNNIFAIIVLTTFFGLLGCRLMAVAELLCLQEHASHNHEFFSDLFDSRTGMTWLGGFLLNILIVTVLLFFKRQDKLLEYLDTLGMACALGYGVGRLGCFFSGDGCYGTYTNLPWGMYFPYGNSPNLLPVHPTPLYESLLSLTLFFVLIKIDSKMKKPGIIFGIFLLVSSMNRFFIEFVRINERFFMNLSLAQLISIVLIIASLTILYKTNTHKYA